jgi:hypothetical protein
MPNAAPDANLFLEQLPSPAPNGASWQPTKAMFWYDSIIDFMLSHPGCSYKEIAADLGRHPVTIGLVVKSDLFKARYAQRKEHFNAELDARLTGKLAKVAEMSLDLTLESLEKKRTQVPLPLLHEMADTALSRLGYGPKASANPSVQVNVSSGNISQVVAPVSAEALSAARQNLRIIEGSVQGAAKSIGPEPEERGEPSSGSVAAGNGEEDLGAL